MQRLRKGGPTPRDLLSAVALHNAARAVSATAGSTNAALHLLAIAHEAGVPFDLEEFEAAATSTPVIADLKPGGRYTRSEEHTSELQSLMRISYAVFCLKKKKQKRSRHSQQQH